MSKLDIFYWWFLCYAFAFVGGIGIYDYHVNCHANDMEAFNSPTQMKYSLFCLIVGLAWLKKALQFNV